MSPELQVVLTVVEIVALVGALAFFLVLLTGRLRSASDALAEVKTRTGALEGRFEAIAAAAADVNRALEQLATELPERTPRAGDSGPSG